MNTKRGKRNIIMRLQNQNVIGMPGTTYVNLELYTDSSTGLQDLIRLIPGEIV